MNEVLKDKKRKEKAEKLYHDAAKLYCDEDVTNPKESFKLFRKAADMNHPIAAAMTGYCYEYGYGIRKNLLKAIDYYYVAAALGSPIAQLALAEIHFDLAGNPPEDYEEDPYEDNRDFQYAAYWYDRFLSHKKLCRPIEKILWDDTEIIEIEKDLESLPKLIIQNKKIRNKSKISKKPVLKLIKK